MKTLSVFWTEEIARSVAKQTAKSVKYYKKFPTSANNNNLIIICK